MSSLEKTERARVKRLPKRGLYDRDKVYEIIDAAYIAHVGFMDGEQPFVLPTACWRVGDELMIHGARVGRMMKACQGGRALCVTMTHLDGFVLARSAFHHSMNYRSVVLFGQPRSVIGSEKEAALKAFVDHIVPDRWDGLRPMNATELKATEVLAIPIEEGAAKVRTGYPVDDKADYELDIWAGVLPISLNIGKAIPDPQLAEGCVVPASVHRLSTLE